MVYGARVVAEVCCIDPSIPSCIVTGVAVAGILAECAASGAGITGHGCIIGKGAVGT